VIDYATAPSYIQAFWEVGLYQARDVILMHRYLYYVAGKPEISDQHYDHLEWFFRYKFPNDRILDAVGSSLPRDYAPYIQELRRPHWIDRAEYHVP